MRTALSSAALLVVLGAFAATAPCQQDPRPPLQGPPLQGSVERLDQSLHRMEDWLQDLRRADQQKVQKEQKEAKEQKEREAADRERLQQQLQVVRDTAAAKEAEVAAVRAEGDQRAKALQSQIAALEKECLALREQARASDAARVHDAERSRQALEAARSSAQEAAARDAAAEGRLGESMQELLRLRQTVADLRAETERCLAAARQQSAAALSANALGGLRRAFAAELDDLGRLRAAIGDLLTADRVRADEESAVVRALRAEVRELRTAAENLRRRIDAGREPL
jgi:DNA repair exonuclease SbcCD ATPase subunit